MSYQDGWAAMDLRMPPRIPRVEASVNSPCELAPRSRAKGGAVTGIDVTPDSDGDTRWRGIKEFIRTWNWDMVFNSAVSYNVSLHDPRSGKIIFFCDGNYTEFLDDIAACGNTGFWFEVFTDLDEVVESLHDPRSGKFGRTHVIIGNGDTRVLTFGTRKEIRAEVKRCMAAGKNCPGYFMCISGHIPANVPVENAIYYNEVYQKLSRR